MAWGTAGLDHLRGRAGRAPSWRTRDCQRSRFRARDAAMARVRQRGSAHRVRARHRPDDRPAGVQADERRPCTTRLAGRPARAVRLAVRGACPGAARTTDGDVRGRDAHIVVGGAGADSYTVQWRPGSEQYAAARQQVVTTPSATITGPGERHGLHGARPGHQRRGATATGHRR